MGEVIPMKEGDVVATEVAEAAFASFVEAMDLDINPEGMDAEDRKSLDNERRVFLRAVRLGRLVVDEGGQAVYTPVKGNLAPITFHEYTGASLMEMDRAKKNHDIKKSTLLLAAITKESPARFANMKARDLKVCQAVLGFLLGG